MFHVFSLVCFLIYGVKSRSGHDRSKIAPVSAQLFKPKCGLNNRIIRTVDGIHSPQLTNMCAKYWFLQNILPESNFDFV